MLKRGWDDAHKKLDSLLDELNRFGYNFTRDFVLKVCLTLLDQKAQYEVSKFRKKGVRKEIEKSWLEISKAVKDVLDFIRGKTFVQSDKALHSYLGLIPLIYFRYKYPQKWKKQRDLDTYLLRILLSRAFSGTPDQLINECVDNINKKKKFDVNSIFTLIRDKNKSLELTEENIWKIGYGSGRIHLFFNLWYRQFNHQPAYEGNLPQIDHIFPQSLLRSQTKVDSESKRRVQKYNKLTRDQLANCMLLTQSENGAGGKGDTPPSKWFSKKTKKYLDMHFIPRDKSLWEIERFEDFIEARKKLIKQKCKELFLKSAKD